MLSHILDFLDSEKFLQFLFVNISRGSLEKQGLSLAISQLAKFIEFLRTIIDLPTNIAAMSEDKRYIVAVFHDGFK